MGEPRLGFRDKLLASLSDAGAQQILEHAAHGGLEGGKGRQQLCIEVNGRAGVKKMPIRDDPFFRGGRPWGPGHPPVGVRTVGASPSFCTPSSVSLSARVDRPPVF